MRFGNALGECFHFDSASSSVFLKRVRESELSSNLPKYSKNGRKEKYSNGSSIEEEGTESG
jgi:hypothetical protein